jgi:hypothetical protein
MDKPDCLRMTGLEFARSQNPKPKKQKAKEAKERFRAQLAKNVKFWMDEAYKDQHPDNYDERISRMLQREKVLVEEKQTKQDKMKIDNNYVKINDRIMVDARNALRRAVDQGVAERMTGALKVLKSNDRATRIARSERRKFN